MSTQRIKYVHTDYIEKLEELKSKVPVEWIHGAQIDFPELIYMKFDSAPLAAIQIAGEVTDTYSAATAHALIEYILALHSASDKLIQEAKRIKSVEKQVTIFEKSLDETYDLLHSLFSESNFFVAAYRFIKEWRKQNA